MMKYPQYSIRHFYELGYKEGGLAFEQLESLYDYAMKFENEDKKFQAKIHGIDVDKESKKGTTNHHDNHSHSATQENVKEDQQSPLPVFGDPSKYSNMSQEERDRLTERMMSKHKQWVGESQPLASKG